MDGDVRHFSKLYLRLGKDAANTLNYEKYLKHELHKAFLLPPTPRSIYFVLRLVDR